MAFVRPTARCRRPAQPRNLAATSSYNQSVGNLSASEIAIILVIGLLLFGAKLPQVGRSLGKAFTEFKRGLKGMEDDFDKAQRDADRELDEEEREKQRRPPEHAPTGPEPLPPGSGDLAEVATPPDKTA
jgi:sec-independent protein translocase protein TatA